MVIYIYCEIYDQTYDHMHPRFAQTTSLGREIPNNVAENNFKGTDRSQIVCRLRI